MSNRLLIIIPIAIICVVGLYLSSRELNAFSPEGRRTASDNNDFLSRLFMMKDNEQLNRNSTSMLVEGLMAVKTTKNIPKEEDDDESSEGNEDSEVSSAAEESDESSGVYLNQVEVSEEEIEKELLQIMKEENSTGIPARCHNMNYYFNTENTANEISNTTEREPMNVLVLYPDDWRHDELGSTNPQARTPFLNSLASDGIRFTHNCVTTSICWMSRATLFTGQYASEHQSTRLKCPFFAKPSLWEETAWPALLQKQNYHVGHVGKWQYHNDPSILFDWSNFFEGHHWFDDKHASDLAREKAIQFLNERPKDKPFAMTVAFYPPKALDNGGDYGIQYQPKKESRDIFDNIEIIEPYNMTKAYKALPKFLQDDSLESSYRWRARFRTPKHYEESMKNYWALVHGVDKACKEIVDEVKRQGLYNNTMIIFTSDNGMFHGSHGIAGKWYPYQESIRVPLIIHDPRMPEERKGTLDDSFTLNIDLAETILGAAGIKPPNSMQGRDIADLYLPTNRGFCKKWRHEFFYEFPSLLPSPFIYGSTALVRKNWKYIHWPEKNYEQLFNLQLDPLEMNDLWGDKNGRESEVTLQEMRRRHHALRKKVQDKPDEEKKFCDMDKPFRGFS